MRVIPVPMSLITMRDKCLGLQYRSFREFQSDFDLIISNCERWSKVCVFGVD